MPEVYLALKTGAIDGQENPLSILNAAKFYEVTEQVALTSHMVQPVFFDIAKPVWDKLSPDQQKAVLDAAAAQSRQCQRRRSARRREDGRRSASRAAGLAVDAIDLTPVPRAWPTRSTASPT